MGQQNLPRETALRGTADSRPSKRRRGRLVGLAGATVGLLALVAACGSGGDDKADSPTVTSSASSVLGPVNAAAGAPVKIGFISDGKTDISDNSIEITVAKATVKYLNQHKAGIGGRPIELVSCESAADPSKGTDCANRLIEEKVVATVIGASTVIGAAWEPLHAAHIPVMLYSGVTKATTQDTESTFAIQDNTFGFYTLPIQRAKDTGLKKVTYVVIDVPAAVDSLKTVAPGVFQKAGVALNVVAVPPGTADMTPQMQNIVSKDPGLVFVLGNDSFCISAFKGLQAVGFTGPISTIGGCITDATRKAVPGSILKGMTVAASAPIGADNASTRLYNAVAETYGSGIDTTRNIGMTSFIEVTALVTGAQGITGDITAANITSTIKKAPQRQLAGALDIGFRCNGKADPLAPSTCVRGGIISVLDDKGQPQAYKVLGATPIED